MATTAYIHKHIRYYFSYSECIDLEIGSHQPFCLSTALDLLEETNIIQRQRAIDLLCALLYLENYLFEGSQSWHFTINDKNTQRFIQSEGIKIAFLALSNWINQLQKNQIGICQQMVLKSLFNIFYTGIYFVNSQSIDLRTFLKDMQVDAFFIKLITLSLQVNYLPIKKIAILYTRILSIQFGLIQFYEDADLLNMAHKNLLPEDYLRLSKEKNQPKDVPTKKCPIFQYYAKYNIGDCPLAQSIVVGLLRSLLTICNSHTHKKFIINSSNSGSDAYRQWQLTYQFLERYPSYSKNLSQKHQTMISNYREYNESLDTKLATHHQFYSHKIYTAASISVFFSFLLHSFNKSVLIHFTYLYQLIADANGILVFLKFLTDKFQNLSVPQFYQTFQQNLTFQNQVMLTVYSVLTMLFGACNNYPEKAKNFLFEYNSYLIIKKIPHLFMKNHKNDEQLPSKQQIEEQFGEIQKLTPIKVKVKQLTILCYDLLKIQIPFFSKKIKESSNNMRMIVEIYCELPRKVQPIERSQMDKILLKSKMRKNQQQNYIRSIQELKSVHHQYNNYYFWTNDRLNQSSPVKQEPQLEMTKQQIENWLEANVWKYFD